MNFLWVALGGACGALARYALTLFFSGQLFPWVILGINIAGSFAIGLLVGLYAQSEWFNLYGRGLLVVGLLGGFTTFSAFSLETLTMLQDGRWPVALIYVVSSVLGCIGAVALGWLVTR